MKCPCEPTRRDPPQTVKLSDQVELCLSHRERSAKGVERERARERETRAQSAADTHALLLQVREARWTEGPSSG